MNENEDRGNALALENKFQNHFKIFQLKRLQLLAGVIL